MPSPHAASRKDWLALGVITLPCVLYSMDLTVLNLAIPRLAADLKPSASELLWIIDIYGFMVAGFLLIMGSLGDRVGRRKVLLIGAAAFGVASVLAAFATSPTQLIVARAALGVAGATLAPSTLSLITTIFRDERERTFAISIWILGYSVGAMLGPVIGGVLINYFWWGSVFLAGVPVMILLLILGPLLLPEHRNADAGAIDYLSALLSLLGVLCLIYGVKLAAEQGFSAEVLTAISAGLVLGLLFVRRQGRLAEPLVDLKLFASAVFSLSLVINVTAMFFMFGAFVFTAQYLQLVAGLTPLAAGVWSLPSAMAFAVASPFTARLVARYSADRVMTVGLIISALGFALLAVAGSVESVVVANVVLSVGFTPVVALTTAFVVGSVPVEKAGMASALSETGAELGGALGIAVLGSFLTALYRGTMSDALPPGLPADLARAAETTLAGAVEAAATLAPATGDALLVIARGAFMEAFQWSALLAAASLTAAALITIRVLTAQQARNARSGERG